MPPKKVVLTLIVALVVLLIVIWLFSTRSDYTATVALHRREEARREFIEAEARAKRPRTTRLIH